jgi:Rad3-related DNA helicases
MRAAVAATEVMRERFGRDDKDRAIEFICQGEDQTSTLVREFARDARTCLFGTLSLWQGVDVPGSACQLVIIDRIPFPRPDDPLSSARSQAIARMGGNGFMAVAATHAALRLAQGAGRLVRRDDDRGVVAILDSRMITARYAGFLQKSLPPFWPTIDKAMVLAALKRLDETAAEPLPVHEPALRGVAGAIAGTSVGDPSGDDGEDGEDGEDDRPVAEAPPVAPSARTAVTQGRAWTSAEDEELHEGVDIGLTLDELASHLDLLTDVVAARLTLLGLEVSDAPKMF